MLLRNINPSEGLCNGTRLVCRRLDRNILGAEIVSGQHAGKFVFIPRIPLEPSDRFVPDCRCALARDLLTSAW
ncbi:hypothetical protein OROHE_012857 [Orobanche hederae]